MTQAKTTHERIWRPTVIKGKKLQSFAEWLNRWGDIDKHPPYIRDNKITEFGRGYERAISDVFDKLGFDFVKDKKRGKLANDTK